jgi:ATP-dependent Clp protease ATP-binding subunit ClpC
VDIEKLTAKCTGYISVCETPIKEITQTKPRTQKTPTLMQYGRDLTALARLCKLDPVVGRESEISRAIEILCRRLKNNPCFVGDPGVGKTAVAEGIAECIVSGNVPDCLLNKRIFSVDLSAMVAGTKYRGDFEERVRNCIEEVKRAGDIILFIDEIHTIVGAGAAEGSIDAANILKPSLARGEIQLIGSTTTEEYRRCIEKDPALDRRFNPLTIKEPNKEKTFLMLSTLKERYESHHQVKIPDDALTTAINLSERYAHNRFFPDKAIDLIDEAAAMLRNRSDKASTPTLTPDIIKQIASQSYEIPLSDINKTESERLLNMEQELSKQIIGQPSAVSAVSRGVRRNRAGLKDDSRPIGSFLFLGPTGVGKTKLAKTLAHILFGDEKAMVRLDMSEFKESHSISKLIGAPAGYVGYESEGELTGKVRTTPYSIVLFDEIEKAHPDILNLLLQILEDGFLTDSKGKKAFFTNTIVILTSNLGAEKLNTLPLGFCSEAQNEEKIKKEVMSKVKTFLRPELENRIDEIILFNRLSSTDIKIITQNMLNDLSNRCNKLGFECTFSPDVLEKIASLGFDSNKGARPLRRVIQTELEDKIAQNLIENGTQDIKIELKDNQFVLITHSDFVQIE